jgi:hypothetical protein
MVYRFAYNTYFIISSAYISAYSVYVFTYSAYLHAYSEMNRFKFPYCTGSMAFLNALEVGMGRNRAQAAPAAPGQLIRHALGT